MLDSLRGRASRYARPLSPAAESQALLPRGAEAWPNPLGTAPGILILQAGKPVVLLPGVPAEMEAIATAHLVPYLKARSSIAVESFTLRTAGVFETWLHQKIGRASAMTVPLAAFTGNGRADPLEVAGPALCGRS